jgi:hypothetical protein
MTADSRLKTKIGRFIHDHLASERFTLGPAWLR